MPRYKLKCKECGKEFENETFCHTKSVRGICDECRHEKDLDYARRYRLRKKEIKG